MFRPPKYFLHLNFLNTLILSVTSQINHLILYKRLRNQIRTNKIKLELS